MTEGRRLAILVLIGVLAGGLLALGSKAGWPGVASRAARCAAVWADLGLVAELRPHAGCVVIIDGRPFREREVGAADTPSGPAYRPKGGHPR